MDRTDLHNLLRDVSGNNDVKIKSVELIDEGTGFISDVFHIEIESLEGSQIPEELVMKTPALIKGHADATFHHGKDEEKKENEPKRFTKAEIIRKVHNNECLCYDIFRQYGEALTNVHVPRVYSMELKNSSKPGHILMQDLGFDGYEMVDFQTGLDLDSIYRLVDSIIDMHMFSFAHPEIVQMLDAFPLYAYEWFPFHGSKIVQSLEEHHKNIYRLPRSKVSKIFNFEVIKSMSTFNGPMVLVHGSLWANNLFVHGNGSQPPAIIDWQLAHKGSPSEDISRLLTSALSPEMRRNYEADVTGYYLKELRSKCEKESIEVPFSDAEFLQWYMKDFQFCANMLLGQTGMLLMHQDSQKLGSDETSFDYNQILTRAIAACSDALNVV